MTGRYGHDPFDREDRPSPRQSKPRVKIESETAAKTIPQRKKRKLISPNVNRPKRDDLRTLIKSLILENENRSVDEIAAKLDRSSHIDRITITNIRSEFKQTLKFLREHGNLKRNNAQV
jgi:hypothetical protein